MICNCVNCFPRLNTTPASKPSNAWCKKQKNDSPLTLGILLVSLPLDCTKLILGFLSTTEILSVRKTCKSAFYCNFMISSQLRYLESSCFTDGLIAFNEHINPMTIGKCPHCLGPSISRGMWCGDCIDLCEAISKQMANHVRDWCEKDNYSLAFLKKREKYMRCYSIENGTEEFFRIEFYV